MRSSLWARYAWGVTAAVIVTCTQLATGQTPSLTLIPPPAGRIDTFAGGLSSDGRFLTGYTQTSNGTKYGFTWTRSGGLNEWGSGAGVPTSTRPVSISDDGSVATGTRDAFPAIDSFQHRSNGYHSLSPIPGGYDQMGTYAASGNGSIAVGYLASSDGSQLQRAMRWTAATGAQNMGTARPGDFASAFTGISRDGSTVLATSARGINGNDAFTWTESGGWNMLAPPPGTSLPYDARPLSSNSNGTIITGWVEPIGQRGSAVVWRNGVGSTLPVLVSGWDSTGIATNANGSILVGNSIDPVLDRGYATLWIENGRALNLQEYLASLGVSTPFGWRLESTIDISDDGQTISGWAINGARRQAYIATIPSPSTVGVGVLFFSVFAPRRRR